MGWLDQLFPYDSERERIETQKDQDQMAEQPRGLLSALQMDTKKYMRPTPGYAFVAGDPRAQGLESLIPGKVPNIPMNDPAQLEKQQTEQKPYPTDPDKWDFWQKMDILTTDRAGKEWEEARRQQGLPYGGDVRSKDAYKKASEDQKATQEKTAPKEFLPEDVATTAPVDPQQQMIADIMRQRAMLDAIYPQRNTANPDQTAADDYGLDARARAAQEAQLAFFAGITKGAGGNWVGVGEGLAAAGQAYDTGFQRYQQALQDKANRTKGANDTAYADDAARTNAAVSLYSDEKKLDVSRLKEAGDQQKDRIKSIDDYFKTTEPKMGDYPDPEKEKAWQAWKRMYDISRERGAIVSSADDVR